MFGQFVNPEFSSETVCEGYFSPSFQAIEPLGAFGNRQVPQKNADAGCPHRRSGCGQFLDNV